MDTKRFWTLQKEFRSVDASWTMERLNLQVHYEMEGKKKQLVAAETEGEDKELSAMRRKTPKTLPLAWKILCDRKVCQASVFCWTGLFDGRSPGSHGAETTG